MSNIFKLVNEMEDFNLTFELRNNESVTTISTGSVTAHFENKTEGIGNGTYMYDTKTEMLAIIFDGQKGPETSGGWNNQNLQISMTAETFSGKTKSSVRVLFNSKQFYSRILFGTLTPAMTS